METTQFKVADHIVQYANKHGMWPTIDFIVKRWIESNPEEFETFKKYLEQEKNNLQNKFGTNETSRKGKMPMKRTLEVPEKIVELIMVLFTVEKAEYPGGDKAFWREFAKRNPVFKIGN